MQYFNLQSVLGLLAITSYGSCVLADVIVTTAGHIPAANQTWGFNPSDRCRLLAHKSAIVKNNQQYALIIDGGFGSFQTRVNGINTQVLDLNPFTAAFDLSKDFSTPGLVPSWFYRKPYNSTQRFSITNHGGLWTSKDGNTLWYQGGHYYNAANWSDGLYHVDKSEIPSWQLWQLDVNNHQNGWKDVTNNTIGHEFANRTFAGAAVTVPELATSYYVGGLLDDTTSSTTPNGTLQTSAQMLIYNETSSTLVKQEFYSADATEGYYQGNLIHLPIGPKQGYLMSLMSLSKPLNSPWVDPDGESGNTELADPVTLDSIPLYDLETGEWFNQNTAWFMDQVPAPRTRFCSALFQDETDNSWNLWVHGGQLISDQSQGVSEIYVLSMPSFIWSKVETTLSDTNLIRSHTCHAIGSQFVIVGGYPPGVLEPTNVTCDPEYIKVLKVEEDSISWDGSFNTNSQYKTPRTIRNVVNGRTTPIAGFANTKLQTDFAHKAKSSSKTGAIAGGVVGGLVVMVIIGFFVWRYLRRRRAQRSTHSYARPETVHVVTEYSPRGASTPPEVVKDGNVPGNRQTWHQSYPVEQRPPVTRVTPQPMWELESPTTMRQLSPNIDRRPSRPGTDYHVST